MLTQENDRFQDAEAALCGYAYRGRSIGSEETCHQFPGEGFAFDAGKGPISATHINRFLLSHGHNDHIGGVPSLCWRRGGHALPPAEFYFEDPDALYALLRAQGRLAGLRGNDWLPMVHSIEPNKRFWLNKVDCIQPWRAAHRIPTLGFTMFRGRKRLRPEFQGKSSEEIIAAKKQRIAIEEWVERPEITYCGDTTIQALDHEFVRKSRLLILECSFVDDEVAPRDAFKTGHVHLADVIDASKRGLFDDNEMVLLTHFSARYTANAVRHHLRHRLPPGKFKALLGAVEDV